MIKYCAGCECVIDEAEVEGVRKAVKALLDKHTAAIRDRLTSAESRLENLDRMIVDRTETVLGRVRTLEGNAAPSTPLKPRWYTLDPYRIPSDIDWSILHPDIVSVAIMYGENRLTSKYWRPGQ